MATIFGISSIFDVSKYYSPNLLLAGYDLNLAGDILPAECQQPRKLLLWIELDYYIDVAVKDLTAYQAALSKPNPTYAQVYRLQTSLSADFNNMNKVVDSMLDNPYIKAPLRIVFLKSVQFTELSAQIIKNQQSNDILPATYVTGLLEVFQTFNPMIDYQLNVEMDKTELKKFATDLKVGITAIKQYQAAVLAGTSTDDLLLFQANIGESLLGIQTDTSSLMLTESVGSKFYNFIAEVSTSLAQLQSDIDNKRYETVILKTIISPGVEGDIVSNVLPRGDMNVLLTNLEADSAYMINVLKSGVLDDMISGCVAAIVDGIIAW